SIVNVENGGNVAANTIVWDQTTTPALTTVARGASVTLAFTAKVSASVADGTTIANQASIVSRDITGHVLTDDPSTPAPSDPTVIRVTAPKLVVTKRFLELSAHPNGANDVEPGDNMGYDIKIENQGSVAATGVIVTDTLPPQGLVNINVLNN